VVILKFDLTIALADRPGQLIKALEPIAKNGGNIISIIHEREEPSAGFVPVSLVVDFPSKSSLRRTVDDLKRMGIGIIRAEEIIDTSRLTVILIGKMDLKRLTDTGIENVKIVGFEVSDPTSEDACLKLELEVPTESVEEALDELKRIAEAEGALLLSPI
jgi:ACT domain-containing protein